MQVLSSSQFRRYGTTQQFLHVFGLNDLKELPELRPDLPEPADTGQVQAALY